MAAATTARSGFFDTIPSPLVRTAGWLVEDDVDSDGELVKTTGRPKVITSAATITEQVTAIPSGTRLTRISPTQRSSRARGNTYSSVMSGADWISAARLLLVPILWPLAVTGHGRLVGVGLLVAGLTDFLDGRVARRSGHESRHGARLDAIADTLLLVSAAAWLQILHPEILRDNRAMLAATAAIYSAAIAANLIAFRRLVDTKQLSAKVAGGLLYAFALVTLLTGAYEPLLLRVASLALAISSVEGLVAAIMTIHERAIAKSPRCQAPQASNDIAIKAGAVNSMPTSARPTASETRR
ncbi:MAG: CDP-alcohol phosphatidyltransferase family protein [Chloroflexi bacterium]|nr:MAG: CDP-alcohol phosphatidyltransferase family protein [Chloroflexota bacterium]